MVTKFEEFRAELIGTFVLLLLGNGVVAMNVLFAGTAGDFSNINIAWGLAVMFGIYASGRITGAHLNPAVTVSLALSKRFPANKIWYFILAQVIGAFLGAAIVFFVYYKKIIQVDPNLMTTQGIFSTAPAIPGGILPGMFDQIVGTAILLFFILAVGDAANQPPGSNLTPIFVGLIVVVIGMSFGGMHGYAINPARDFGPRLFTVVAGYTNNGLTDGTGYWIVPIIGPIVGSIVGVFLYDFTVGKTMKKMKDA